MLVYNFLAKNNKGSSEPSHQQTDTKQQSLETTRYNNESVGQPSGLKENLNQAAGTIKSSIKFTKNLKKKDVEIKLFIYESMTGFQKLSFREKCSLIICNSDETIQKEYYSIAIKEGFSEDWMKFKEFIINNCTGKRIIDLKKYKEETRRDFLERLQMTCAFKKVSEEKAIAALRQMKLPTNIQVLVFGEKHNLGEIIEIVSKFEVVVETKSKPDSFEKKRSDITCFKCGEYGHIQKYSLPSVIFHLTYFPPRIFSTLLFFLVKIYIKIHLLSLFTYFPLFSDNFIFLLTVFYFMTGKKRKKHNSGDNTTRETRNH